MLPKILGMSNIINMQHAEKSKQIKILALAAGPTSDF